MGILGPATNLLTALCDFDVAGVHWSDTNTPGLLLFLINVVLLVLVLVFVVEPSKSDPTSAKSESDKPKSTLEDLCTELKKPAVLMCFLVMFDFNAFISSSEAVVVPVTQHAHRLLFKPLQNSFVYAGVSVWMIGLTIMIMKLGKKVSDRGLVLF